MGSGTRAEGLSFERQRGVRLFQPPGRASSRAQEVTWEALRGHGSHELAARMVKSGRPDSSLI